MFLLPFFAMAQLRGESGCAPLIWLDLEMTGLDPETDTVIEIATLVTDGDLHVVEQGPDLVIHQPNDVLEGMSDWCKEHHGRSGLIDSIRASTISLVEAEAETLAFLSKHCEAGKSPLCGNTIGQDRRFIVRYMQKLDSFLHYRSVDVSSIKEMAKRWYPDLPPHPKEEQHRAMGDVLESVDELRYYRKHLFVDKN